MAVREKIYHPESVNDTRYQYSVKNISSLVSNEPVLKHL